MISLENKKWIEPTLVQRLLPPSENKGLNITSDRVDLSRFWTLDYMGKIEFEGENVLNSLFKMTFLHKNKLLDTFTTEAYVSNNNELEEVTFYGICHKKQKKEVIDFIYKASDGNIKIDPGLSIWQTIEKNRISPKIVGWLELDNPFMFFTDISMYERACILFKIPGKLKHGIFFP